MRVHELARELELKSKDVIDALKAEGQEVKGHMSVLDERLIALARKKVRPSAVAAGKKKPVAKAKAAGKPQKSLGVKSIPKVKASGAPVQNVEPEAPSIEEVVPLEELEEEELEEEIPQKDLAKIVGGAHAEKKDHTDASEILPPKPKATPTTAPTIDNKRVELCSPIVVKELAEKLGLRPNELIAKLIGMGVFASINQNLDERTATRVAQEYGCELIISKEEEPVLPAVEASAKFGVAPDDPRDLMARPPIVTFMGHVDHGKTSLLDFIRKTRVTAREVGGITQHMGAYHVTIPAGTITFLDTPGHKAFTAMRARGADVTDIVVLVVAADDGVMPQTEEAIDHCKEAKVPIVVAVNKTDLPNINPEKVRRQLADLGLQPEEWGGEVIFVDVSAKTGKGIDHLLEMLILQAEVMELKANPKRAAKGVVVEAKLTKGRGPAATVLIQNGTLCVGDPILCGLHAGKVKALISDTGEMLRQAGPAIPVEVLGLGGVPHAGDEFFATKTEQEAKRFSELRKHQKREKSWGAVRHTTLDDLYKEIVEGETKELKLIVKGDVQGSVEALVKSVQELDTKKVSVKVVHAMVGDISESDVMLASASNAVIIGFHAAQDAKIRDLAKRERVEIRMYKIIYDAVEDIRKAMEGLLDPKVEVVVIGRAQVREVFKISKAGKIAGCMVKEGKMVRNCKVRLIRNEKVLYEGQINALKRFKDEAKEVKVNFECGIKLAAWDDLAEGDVIEAYVLETTAQVL